MLWRRNLFHFFLKFLKDLTLRRFCGFGASCISRSKSSSCGKCKINSEIMDVNYSIMLITSDLVASSKTLSLSTSGSSCSILSWPGSFCIAANVGYSKIGAPYRSVLTSSSPPTLPKLNFLKRNWYASCNILTSSSAVSFFFRNCFA